MTVHTRALRLGTRRSALARAQSATVAAALTAGGQPVEVVEVSTAGDRSTDAVATLGGTGVFVTGLRDQLLAGEIDLAVHSLKDLPTLPAAGLTVAAVPAREDPLDVLVTADGSRLGDLAAGARIGTGAPRRAAQLRALARGFEVVPIRGNVDTRLAKLAAGEVDALVLAGAGLARLGRLDAAAEVLPPDIMLPAPGQGALAVEIRTDDLALHASVEALDDAATRSCVTAERTLLAALEAGCTAPVGALATRNEAELHLEAVVASLDGGRVIRMSLTGARAAAAQTAHRLAGQLFAAGAADVIGVNR